MIGALVLFTPNAQATAVFGNGIYEVHVEEASDFGQFGSWNAVTGASHPTGPNNNIMYNQLATTTNFSSLRVFGAAAPRDYTWGGAGGGINLDPFLTLEGPSGFSPTGLRQTWSIVDESIDIVQDVFITGTTFNNSAVYHTVELTNTGGSAVSVGWRNLYDWAVNDPGFDDGPNNQIELSDGTVQVPATTLEFSHTPAADEVARVTVDPGVPTYEPLLALGFDPNFFPGLPVTLPDEYAYVSWPSSFGTSFDYTPTGANVTADSAGLSWFGRDLARAIELGAGDSVRLTQIVFGVPPGEPPPTVPEPSTILLIGTGLVGLVGLRRKFKA